MATLTEFLDNLYTTTWQNMKGAAADQIFDATPFYFWMRNKGAFDTVEGGRFLTEPLRFAKSDNIKWVSKGSQVSLSDKEFLTVAVYDWRYLVDTIVRFGTDDQQNRGRNLIMSLMQAKLDNSKDSLIDELETRLFGTAGVDEMLGLQDIVPDDPAITGSTLGGIDPSVDTWWRNQEAAAGGAWDVADQTEIDMNKMLNDCGNNLRQDMPDLILTGQVPYQFYYENQVTNIRHQNTLLLEAGFTTQNFRGVPMVWSPACRDTVAYFINSRFLRVKYDPMLFFDMTEWKPIVDQVNDRAAQVVTALNLVTGRRRVHGVITAIAAT